MINLVMGDENMYDMDNRTEDLRRLQAGNLVGKILLKFHLCRQIGGYPVFQAIDGNRDLEQLASFIASNDIDLKQSLRDFYMSLELAQEKLQSITTSSFRLIDEEIKRYQQLKQVIDIESEKPYLDNTTVADWLKMNLGNGSFSNTEVRQTVESLGKIKRKKMDI